LPLRYEEKFAQKRKMPLLLKTILRLLMVIILRLFQSFIYMSECVGIKFYGYVFIYTHQKELSIKYFGKINPEKIFIASPDF